MSLEDFDPPLKEINIFDIIERWDAPFCRFDLSGTKDYDERQAFQEAVSDLLRTALTIFWVAAPEEIFHKICLQILEAEGFETGRSNEQNGLILIQAKMRITEPGGFRRFEDWSFELKHFQQDNLTDSQVKEMQTYLGQNNIKTEIRCLMTSADCSSIGRHISLNNPYMRLWDREILFNLLCQHTDIVAPFFPEFKIALDEISKLWDSTFAPVHTLQILREFETKLDNCPKGQKSFALYEKLGIEIWNYLFCPNIGQAESQVTTYDAVQRRDALAKNNMGHPFWIHLGTRFGSEFVILDFKNYAKVVTPKEVNDVVKYANKMIGRFIFIVSRKGASKSCEATQMRWLREDICVLILSDSDLLQMIRMKSLGEAPEEFLNTRLDEMKKRY
jgi:hypothetical protein